MRIGKVSGNVYERSVTKQIKTSKKMNQKSAGDFCAFLVSSVLYGTLDISKIELTELFTLTFWHAFQEAVCAGVIPKHFSLHILLPPHSTEDELRAVIRKSDECCSEHKLTIGQVDVDCSSAVTKPVFEITLTGIRQQVILTVEPGDDIIVAGAIASEGTYLLAREKENELLTRYPYRMVEDAKLFYRFLAQIPEAATAVWSNVSMIEAAGEGGVFKTLWNLADRAGVGLEIDLKKLPVKQETIEICNFFDCNPYELLTGGSLVCTGKDGRKIIDTLLTREIPAAIVGKVTKGNDRVVINEEERRFLEPAKADEIFRILSKI